MPARFALAASFSIVLLWSSLARAQQNVTWTHLINATASDNSLQKTAGCDGCQDAGGVSASQIGSGTGAVQFAPGSGQELYAGLSHTATTPLIAPDLDFAFAIYPGDVCEIRESGIWKADCTFTAGDVLKVAIDPGPVVRYYRNGWAIYTSSAIPSSYPYVLGADLFNIGATVGDAKMITPSLTDWTSVDVGAVGEAGSASYSGDILAVRGAGAGIGGRTDAFHFVYQTLSGDGEIVTRIDSIQNTRPLAKAGVMLRDGLDPGAAHVMVGLTPEGGLHFLRRASSGGPTASVATGVLPVPSWIKLVRFGHRIAAYYSADGVTWQSAGSTTETMGPTLDAGIVVTSHQVKHLNTSTFESLSLVVSGVGTSYVAVTDRNVYAKPRLPILGRAGSRFIDPTFGSRLMRVTDADTRPGVPGRSFTAPSAAHQLAWNAASDHFYIRSIDGTFIPYTFDATRMKASRIRPSASGDGGLTISSQVEPQFSFLSSNLLFGSRQDAVNDWPIIRQFNFSTLKYTDLLNLGSITDISPGTYADALSSSATAPEKISVLFGGSVQDRHYKVAVFQVSPAGANPIVLDTQASTITSGGTTVNTNVPLGVFLHHAWMDQSGRYVLLYPVNQQPVSYYVWDLGTNTIVPVTRNADGHDATGYRSQVNQSCCTSTSWDAAQWQLRSLGDPATTTDIINPVLTPQEIYLSDHTSWNNAQASTLVPVLSSLFRYDNGTYNTTPWRAWDDEIVAIETGAQNHDATVWRFAHHRSDSTYDGLPGALYFWYMPIAVISPDGKWAIFTSNWEKTLGNTVDSDLEAGGLYRTDVFLLELAQR